VVGKIAEYVAKAFTGRDTRQLPEPYVVDDPILIFTITNTVLPICLYLPVIVPLPIAGFDTLAVQEGLYVVHAAASDAEGPVSPFAPANSTSVITGPVLSPNCVSVTVLLSFREYVYVPAAGLSIELREYGTFSFAAEDSYCTLPAIAVVPL
jgi:hypothetical protein